MAKSTKKGRKIYMDYASSALSGSANPGAIHELGIKEHARLEKARTKIAQILNSRSDEIIFTSGATESNNLAIQGLIHLTPSPLSLARRGVGERSVLPHIITTNIEHASVLEVCKHLEKNKQATVAYVEVETSGIVDVKKIKKALRPQTVLVSVMYANNEIGTVQPIREIAKIIRHHNKINSTKVYFHIDATQAINYLPIQVPQLGIDLMSFNSAKIYGPKGVGALYVKKYTPLKSILFGGGQEFGLRPGTENVSLATELAQALEVTEKIKHKEVLRLTKLRDYFISKIVINSAIAENLTSNEIILNGNREKRLPNNINITIPGIPSDLLVIELSARGIMASAKSACKSGDGKASHVIEAIRHMRGNLPTNLGERGLNSEVDGSLRFSLGRDTTKSDIDYTLKALSQILTKLKKWYD